MTDYVRELVMFLDTRFGKFMEKESTGMRATEKFNTNENQSFQPLVSNSNVISARIINLDI